MKKKVFIFVGICLVVAVVAGLIIFNRNNDTNYDKVDYDFTELGTEEVYDKLCELFDGEEVDCIGDVIKVKATLPAIIFHNYGDEKMMFNSVKYHKERKVYYTLYFLLEEGTEFEYSEGDTVIITGRVARKKLHDDGWPYYMYYLKNSKIEKIGKWQYGNKWFG